MENYFYFRDKRIHYTDTGKGEIILLVHGYLESAMVWKNLSDKLSKKFKIIAIDLPGHGQSEVFTEENSMEFMALIIKELLDFRGISKVFLTGHSLGGYVTLAFLELFPERLSGYCLFHSHPLADSTETKEKREREIKLVTENRKDEIYPVSINRMFAESNLEILQESVRKSMDIASQISPGGMIFVLRAMMARPVRVSLIEKGIVPCLWILGKLDNHISFESILQRVNLPSNAEVVLLENSGHMGFVEEEELSIKAIREFVEKLKI
jgi:pimeloyl-ACP methyl ester carboxylesterase